MFVNMSGFRFESVISRIRRVYIASATLCAAYILYQCCLIAWNPACVLESSGSKLGHSTPSVSPQHPQSPYLDNSSCDPYLQPGALTFNKLDTTQNFWTSFNPECPRAPHFMQDVLERKDLPWLQKKTVLMIGDSIDRNSVAYFCESVNSSDHKSFMHEIRATNLSWKTPTESRIAPPQGLTICRLDDYDFEIAMFWQCGLADEDIFVDKCMEPRMYPQRIPMLIQLFEERGRKPDMLMVGSGLWDLVGWVKMEVLRGAPVEISIGVDLLNRWIERAEDFIGMIENIFPDTFMLWRVLHYCRVDWGDWWLAGLPEGLDKTNRAPFHDARVFQMNSAYTQLIRRKPQLYRFVWGELLTGFKENFSDSIHPNKEFAGVLWGDMLLYYLSRLKSKH